MVKIKRIVSFIPITIVILFIGFSAYFWFNLSVAQEVLNSISSPEKEALSFEGVIFGMILMQISAFGLSVCLINMFNNSIMGNYYYLYEKIFHKKIERNAFLLVYDQIITDMNGLSFKNDFNNIKINFILARFKQHEKDIIKSFVLNEKNINMNKRNSSFFKEMAKEDTLKVISGYKNHPNCHKLVDFYKKRNNRKIQCVKAFVSLGDVDKNLIELKSVNVYKEDAQKQIDKNNNQKEQIHKLISTLFSSIKLIDSEINRIKEEIKINEIKKKEKRIVASHNEITSSFKKEMEELIAEQDQFKAKESTQRKFA